MVIDSSALAAIVLNEPERADFIAKLSLPVEKVMSAANLLEVRMVLHNRGELAIRRLDDLLQRASLQIEPVTAAQSDIAFDAFRRFGKGSGHKAGLNFGDCFAYALASERGLPLLCKGDDFVHTDLTLA